MSDCKFVAPKEPERTRLVPAVLTDPKHLVFVFAGYLYLSGFIYAHFYYSYFGLPFSAGDVPVYNMFIYAVNVFLRFSVVAAMTVAVLVGVAVFNWARKPAQWFEALLLVVLVSFAPVIFYDSASLARRDARDSRAGHRPLHEASVVLKTAVQAEYAQLPGWKKAVTTGQLRLLAQNDDHLYLIFQEFPGDDLPAMRIYWVKREDIAAVEILVNRKQ